MSDPVCCLCGDKLESQPDLEEHIAVRHWDIFDDGKPPCDNGQAATSSSPSQRDPVVNGSNPCDKSTIEDPTKDVALQDSETTKPVISHQTETVLKVPSPKPGPSSLGATQRTQPPDPSQVNTEETDEVSTSTPDDVSKKSPASVKRKPDSPEPGCSKWIRTDSGSKSGNDQDRTPPPTIIKIKKEEVASSPLSPTKPIQDGSERTYFARKSDPPTPKKVPERNETRVSGTSSCPYCHKSFASLKRHIKRIHPEMDLDNTSEMTPGNISTASRSDTRPEEASQNDSQRASVRILYCRICNQGFESSSQLRVHVVSVHRDPEKTDHVSKSETDPEVKDPESFCFVCRHQFPTRSNLNRHNLRKHIDGEKFSCPEFGCTRQFKIEYDLVRHRRNVHGLH